MLREWTGHGRDQKGFDTLRWPPGQECTLTFAGHAAAGGPSFSCFANSVIAISHVKVVSVGGHWSLVGGDSGHFPIEAMACALV